MQAAVFQQLGTPLSVRSVPDPEPRAGEIVLKVRACGVCGTDIHVAGHEGALFGGTLAAGTILGHEFAGEVVEVGRGVAGKWRAGDRVAAFPIFSCGACVACTGGKPVDCRSAAFAGLSGAQGAYAEYAVAPAALSLPLPENLGYAAGAMVEPLAVCVRAAGLAMPLSGASVLIVGAGPIGLLLSALCSHFRAKDVVVADLVGERAARGAKLGATGWIDAYRDDVKPAFRTIAGQSPTIVFDAAGGPGGIQRTMDYAGPGARVVVVAPHEAPSPVSTMTGFLKELTLNFAKAYSVSDYQAALVLVATGAIDISPLVTDTVGLDAFPAVFEGLRRPSGTGKVILDPFLQ